MPMARVGIVTGAASGIGQALATALVNRGDTVVLADVNADGAKQVAAGLRSRASAVGLDVRDADKKGGQWTALTAAQRQLADRRSRRAWPGDATSLGWPGDAASWAVRCRSRRWPSASWPPWACESLVRLCSSHPLRVLSLIHISEPTRQAEISYA